MFKFELSQSVMIEATAEVGVVEARAEYLDYPNNYYVVYKDKAGSFKKEWIEEKHLVSISIQG